MVHFIGEYLGRITDWFFVENAFFFFFFREYRNSFERIVFFVDGAFVFDNGSGCGSRWCLIGGTVIVFDRAYLDGFSGRFKLCETICGRKNEHQCYVNGVSFHFDR